MNRFFGVLVFLIGALAAFALVSAALDFKRQSYPRYITLRGGAKDEQSGR